MGPGAVNTRGCQGADHVGGEVEEVETVVAADREGREDEVDDAEHGDVEEEEAEATPASGEAADACELSHCSPDAVGDGLLRDNKRLFDLDPLKWQL